jgi:hypothetical protein
LAGAGAAADPARGDGLAAEFRGRVHLVGGYAEQRVDRPYHHGQNEAYDPAADRWEAHAPMLTPRHGMGAVAVGDAVHVAGGGPQMGGGVTSAVNEAFTPA